MKKSITTRTGKSFDIEFAHTNYFNVNGCKAEVKIHPTAGKCLIIVGDREKFLVTMGMDWKKVGKPDNVTLQLTDADFTELSAFCQAEKERVAAERQAEIDALPVRYRIAYDGVWLDEYITTNATVEKFKLHNGVVISLGGKKFDIKFLPTDIQGEEMQSRAFPSYEITESEYNRIIEHAAPKSETAKEEKRVKEAVAAEKRKEADKNYNGVHIEYHDDYEMWDGVRMD